MKIKILNRKGEEISSGKYLYLEKVNDGEFYIVFNNDNGDNEICFIGSKEEMKDFKKSLDKELEMKEEK